MLYSWFPMGQSCSNDVSDTNSDLEALQTATLGNAQESRPHAEDGGSSEQASSDQLSQNDNITNPDESENPDHNGANGVSEASGINGFMPVEFDASSEIALQQTNGTQIPENIIGATPRVDGKNMTPIFEFLAVTATKAYYDAAALLPENDSAKIASSENQQTGDSTEDSGKLSEPLCAVPLDGDAAHSLTSNTSPGPYTEEGAYDPRFYQMRAAAASIISESGGVLKFKNPISFARDPVRVGDPIYTIQIDDCPYLIPMTFDERDRLTIYYGSFHNKLMRELEDELDSLTKANHDLSGKMMTLQVAKKSKPGRTNEMQDRIASDSIMIKKQHGTIADMKKLIASLKSKLKAERDFIATIQLARLEELKELSEKDAQSAEQKMIGTLQIAMFHIRKENLGLTAELEKAAESVVGQAVAARDDLDHGSTAAEDDEDADKDDTLSGAAKRKKNKKSIVAKPSIPVSHMRIGVLEKQLLAEKECHQKTEAEKAAVEATLKTAKEENVALVEAMAKLKAESIKHEATAKKALAEKKAITTTTSDAAPRKEVATQASINETKLKLEKSALQKEVKSYKAKADSAGKQLAEATKAIEDYNMDRGKWRAEKDQILKDISKLKKSNSESERLHDALDEEKKETAELKKEIKKLKGDIRARDAEIDQRILEQHQKADKKPAGFDTLDAKIQFLELELTTANIKLEDATRIIAASVEEKKNLVGEKDILQDEKRTLQTENSNLLDYKQALQSEKQTLQAEKTQLSTALDASKLQVLTASTHEQDKSRALQAKIDEQKSNLSTLKDQLIELQQQKLHSDNGSSETAAEDYYHDEPETVSFDEHLELQHKLDDVANEKEELRVRYATMAREMDGLRSTVTSLRAQQKQNKYSQQQAKPANATASNKKNNSSSSNAALAAARDENQRLSNEVAMYKSRLEAESQDKHRAIGQTCAVQHPGIVDVDDMHNCLVTAEHCREELRAHNRELAAQVDELYAELEVVSAAAAAAAAAATSTATSTATSSVTVEAAAETSGRVEQGQG
ncbi:golgin subfamily B member 1 [Microdochium nivale]|nr:golgin subfamily B member 1 [Microdochium nivale]